MQELYLTEQLTTVITPAAYTRTTGVLVPSQNTIVLYTSAFIQFQPGQVISINGGPQYPIQSLVFDSLTLTYTAQVLGGIQPGTKVTVPWSIFNVSVVVNSILLDTEDVDITTVFSIADVADISNRKDSITKNIVLKGTDTNNRAFGHLFFLGRRTSFSFSNKLFFNYAPIRTVDCLLYDNFIPVLRGQLIITEVDVDKNGTVFYQATITGSFISFKNTLAERKLTDLNLRDMEHTYSSLAVVDSWGGDTGTVDAVGNSRTYWVNQVTGVPYTKPFAFGTGYVYPTIDYAEKFALGSLNVSYNRFKMQNFRPALYVREYFNRIMADAGFTYSLQGAAAFIARFNKLIVPDARKDLHSLQSGTCATFSQGLQNLAGGALGGYGPINPASISAAGSYNPSTPAEEGLYQTVIRFDTATNTNRFEWDNVAYPNTPVYGIPIPLAARIHCAIRAKSTLSVPIRVRALGTVKNSFTATNNASFRLQLCVRDRPANGYVEDSSNIREWVSNLQVIAEQTFNSGAVGVTVPFNVDFTSPVTTIVAGQELIVRILSTQNFAMGDMYLTSANLDIPSPAGTLYNVEVQVGDNIVPAAPEGITQMDFIKSIIKALNLYVYTLTDRPKHLYFITYDDYYVNTAVNLAPSTALDWSRKIDHDGGIKIKSNLSLPKKYLFTFKTDSDYLNSTYKTQTGRIYGDFNFNDSLGFVEQKTVDLVFSATPAIRIPGQNRLLPLIATGGTSLATKEKMKSNIRLLYYSGVYYDPQAPTVSEDFWNPAGGDGSLGAWEPDDIFHYEWYALTSNYLFSDYNDIFHSATSKTQPLVPILDVHFAAPLIYFFVPPDNFLSVPTHYSYYIGQTTELTNPNVNTLVVKALINEVDINNLDLRIPIFITLDGMGYAYYKILSVEYTNAYTLSTLTLQKLAI